RDLRLAAAIDALDEREAEFSVVDTPELHAAVRVVRANVVDARHERAALDFDVIPRPFLDRAFRAGVRDVIDLAELRHRSFSVHAPTREQRERAAASAWRAMTSDTLYRAPRSGFGP